MIGVVGFIGCPWDPTPPNPENTEPTKEFDANVKFQIDTVNQGENTAILYNFASVSTNQKISNLKFRFEVVPLNSMKLLDDNNYEKDYYEYKRNEVKPNDSEGRSITVTKTNKGGYISAVAKVVMNVTGNFEDGTEINIEKPIYLTIGKIENS